MSEVVSSGERWGVAALVSDRSDGVSQITAG